MACCSVSAVVMMPVDDLMQRGDWGGGGLRGATLDWERMLLSLGLSSSMVLVTEDPVVSVVPPGLIRAWMWLLVRKGWRAGRGELVGEEA